MKLEQTSVVLYERNLDLVELPELEAIINLERSKRKVKRLEEKLTALEHEDYDDY